MRRRWKRFKELSVQEQKRLRRFLFSADSTDYMLYYMEEHTFVAKRQITQLGPLGKDMLNKKWIELTNDLNILSGTNKSVKQWQEKWNKMRLKAKEEMTAYLKGLKKTGNQSVSEPSENCERICNIFGKYGVSISVIPEIGVVSSLKPAEEDDNFLTNFFKKLSKKRKAALVEYNARTVEGRIYEENLPWNDSCRRSTKQLAKMIDFMMVDERKDMAFGGDTDHPDWIILQHDLNNLKMQGREDRDVSSWQNSWKNFKLKAREKCLKYYQAGEGTAPTPEEQKVYYAENDYYHDNGLKFPSVNDENMPPNSGKKRTQPRDTPPVLAKKLKKNSSWTSKNKFSTNLTKGKFDDSEDSDKDELFPPEELKQDTAAEGSCEKRNSRVAKNSLELSCRVAGQTSKSYRSRPSVCLKRRAMSDESEEEVGYSTKSMSKALKKSRESSCYFADKNDKSSKSRPSVLQKQVEISDDSEQEATGEGRNDNRNKKAVKKSFQSSYHVIHQSEESDVEETASSLQNMKRADTSPETRSQLNIDDRNDDEREWDALKVAKNTVCRNDISLQYPPPPLLKNEARSSKKERVDAHIDISDDNDSHKSFDYNETQAKVMDDRRFCDSRMYANKNFHNAEKKNFSYETCGGPLASINRHERKEEVQYDYFKKWNSKKKRLCGISN